jgi:hypothetical protein
VILNAVIPVFFWKSDFFCNPPGPATLKSIIFLLALLLAAQGCLVAESLWAPVPLPEQVSVTEGLAELPGVFCDTGLNRSPWRALRRYGCRQRLAVKMPFSVEETT